MKKSEIQIGSTYAVSWMFRGERTLLEVTITAEAPNGGWLGVNHLGEPVYVRDGRSVRFKINNTSKAQSGREGK